jgi:signal transduction histidine kinase
VGSPDSSIRSAAPDTSSGSSGSRRGPGLSALPIRWRLAGGSAGLTFVILACFAAIVGVLTTRQVRSQFNDEVRSAADQLGRQLHLRFNQGQLDCSHTTIHLSDYASAEQAQIRIYDDDGDQLCNQTQVGVRGARPTPVTPQFSPPSHAGTFQEKGYRIDVREHAVQPLGEVQVLYARPISDVDHTLGRVQFFLLLGVLGGTVLALLAGLATAQRAIRPIAALTDAAREVERTRDPSRRLPRPDADDEVAELARTLEDMLSALDSARANTEAMLDRQREFVADASHELRTPLTSVLANLELLTEELRGEQAETAEAALRSTRRMRRLVGDLLLLARADAQREHTLHAVNLAQVLTEAAAELEPVADDHELTIHAEPAQVLGIGDDLHRLALNLLENAIRHTPPGTHIVACTGIGPDGGAFLTVEDDGPGIPDALRERIFERFVRSGGDGGRGSGLGLAIVHAVAQTHGGTVTLEQPAPGHGTRFTVWLSQPAAPALTSGGIIGPSPEGSAMPSSSQR